MRTKQKIPMILLLILLAVMVGIGIWNYCIYHSEYGFAREVSEEEQIRRRNMVTQAESFLGAKGGSPEHTEILRIYNEHKPLAQGYLVKPEDSWCATFVSTVAILCEETAIIPTECGCQRQIGLFKELDCWEEADDYHPLPGDIIYYSDWTMKDDNQGWSNHVGIVVGTWMNYIKVIEGNAGNAVRYRYLPINDPTIRGFAIPDYAS